MPLQIRPNVLEMTPYTPGKPIEEVKRELGLDRVVKLASNENPLGPSPKAVEAVRAAAGEMHVYPDASGYELKEVLAKKFGVKSSEVMLGNGSDELIHLLGQIFLTPGTNMVVGSPTFVRYDAAAHLTGAELRKVPLDSEFKHDLRGMAEVCDENTRMVFVANPHNPTGTVVGKADFEAMLEVLPEGCVVVLDEAYHEFARDLEGNPDGVSYVRDGKQVVALRTFSKTYGLAGIRVGYGFASEEIVDAVNRAREPFDVNTLAQVAAMAAIEDDEHLARTCAVNTAGLERITEFAKRKGLRVIPSYANFICVEVGDGGKVFKELLKRGVIVRSGVPLGMPTFVRVSIGTEEEVGVFLDAFADVL